MAVWRSKRGFTVPLGGMSRIRSRTHGNNENNKFFWSIRKDKVEMIKMKSLLYSRNTPMRVTSGGTRGSESEQHSSEETSQRWRAVGDTVPI